MSHFSVFRAKALQSPAHPAPLLTGPRRHAEPVFQRSTEPGNLFTHFIRLPPYAHPLSLGGTRNMPPYAHY